MQGILSYNLMVYYYYNKDQIMLASALEWVKSNKEKSFMI